MCVALTQVIGTGGPQGYREGVSRGSGLTVALVFRKLGVATKK